MQNPMKSSGRRAHRLTAIAALAFGLGACWAEPTSPVTASEVLEPVAGIQQAGKAAPSAPIDSVVATVATPPMDQGPVQTVPVLLSLVSGTLEALAVYEFTAKCPALVANDWQRSKRVSSATADSCIEAIVGSVANKAAAFKLLKPVKVTAFRASLKSALGKHITRSTLEKYLNRHTKGKVTDIWRALFELASDRLADAVRTMLKNFNF